MHCPSPPPRLSLLFASASSPALLGQLCEATEQHWLREGCLELACGRHRGDLSGEQTMNERMNKCVASTSPGAGMSLPLRVGLAFLAFSGSDVGSEIDVSGCPYICNESGRLC